MPCSQYEALFVSAAHTEADIDATIAAAAEVFRSCSKPRPLVAVYGRLNE